jgi:hypothetical protein
VIYNEIAFPLATQMQRFVGEIFGPIRSAMLLLKGPLMCMMGWRDEERTMAMNYWKRVPKSVRRGRVLMHNHVRHSIDMPCGVSGFRAWTDTTPPPGFVMCPCGWSGLPHYAAYSHVEATRGRCDPRSWEELEEAYTG